ncbi:hypothetical protein C5167_051012 [Papaver somniferum]|uniref:Uncharacterized protein n=1 Tax=Papaver somniferum TaxID=3469 RepID=A0A4Y7KTM2_PAPSO|nr:hypothetical protein C5167_051012 [Papaver somniferum]
MAAEIEVEDGTNDEGEMFTWPGKLIYRLPQPYASEQAARFANGDAYPPDLSLITKELAAKNSENRAKQKVQHSDTLGNTQKRVKWKCGRVLAVQWKFWCHVPTNFDDGRW